MGEGWKRKQVADRKKEELKEERVGAMADLKEGSVSEAANLQELKEDQSPRKRIRRAVSSCHPAQVNDTDKKTDKHKHTI